MAFSLCRNADIWILLVFLHFVFPLFAFPFPSVSFFPSPLWEFPSSHWGWKISTCGVYKATLPWFEDTSVDLNPIRGQRDDTV